VSRPLPCIAPGITSALTDNEMFKAANVAVDTFNSAVFKRDLKELARCFYADQSYWRDMVALTSHIRTFRSPSVIAESFLETKAMRDCEKLEFVTAKFVSISPTLVSIILFKCIARQS
jgi:hypothetical protein